MLSSYSSVCVLERNLCSCMQRNLCCAENNSKGSSGSSASEDASSVDVGYVGVLGVLVASFSVSLFTHSVIVENTVCKCVSFINYIK